MRKSKSVSYFFINLLLTSHSHSVPSSYSRRSLYSSSLLLAFITSTNVRRRPLNKGHDEGQDWPSVLRAQAKGNFEPLKLRPYLLGLDRGQGRLLGPHNTHSHCNQHDLWHRYVRACTWHHRPTGSRSWPCWYGSRHRTRSCWPATWG